MKIVKCPCFNEEINCDLTLCRFCGVTEKELKHRASKMFTNPTDALLAFYELKRRRGIK